jgi:hypothetical protein
MAMVKKSGLISWFGGASQTLAAWKNVKDDVEVVPAKRQQNGHDGLLPSIIPIPAIVMPAIIVIPVATVVISRDVGIAVIKRHLASGWFMDISPASDFGVTSEGH